MALGCFWLHVEACVVIAERRKLFLSVFYTLCTLLYTVLVLTAQLTADDTDTHQLLLGYRV